MYEGRKEWGGEGWEEERGVGGGERGGRRKEGWEERGNGEEEKGGRKRREGAGVIHTYGSMLQT